MLSFFKSIFIRTQSQDTYNSADKKESQALTKSSADLREYIRSIWKKNTHLIKEKELYYWVLQKHIFDLEMLFYLSKLVNESVKSQFTTFLELIMINELFHLNRNIDYSETYLEIFKECVKFPKEVLDDAQEILIDIILSISRDTRLLSDQLFQKKSKDEWELIWIHISTIYGDKVLQEPRERYLAHEFVFEFIKKGWVLEKKFKKLD